MSVLEVNHVSIRYMTGDFKEIGLKEYVMRKMTGNYHVNEFWADKDISFTLEQGDMLGIVGTNGAGKSTLLKVVSGIMEPTRGWVKREGSIAALLELGSGFDGELTVKENAYLRGAMLGYTRKFMDDTYDQIIEFAELREFEARSFKQLSSGMKSRLAFAIASLVRPDILILDEVLSVGDGAFRDKSEAKMREIIGSGATTILVSHATSQVRALCNKVLWLHKGEQIAFGETETICDWYEGFLEKKVSLEEAKKQFAGPVIPEKRTESTESAEQAEDKEAPGNPPPVEEESEIKSKNNTLDSYTPVGEKPELQWVNGVFAVAKRNWMMLIPFLSILALLRVSPMMYDGWAGPYYYEQYGGLLSWVDYILGAYRTYINGRVASNFFCGILESFRSEIPLDIAAALVMTGIFAGIIRLFHIRKKAVSACLFTVFIIFMPYSLRVYTVQIALLQYLTPVFFLVLALVLSKKYEETGKWKYIWCLCPLSAIACTWMENTSIAYGIVLTAVCVRLTVKSKKVDFRFLGVILVSLVSGIFMIAAPGMASNRIAAPGAQTFLLFSQERILSHLNVFFDGFIYSGSLAGCTFALILLIASVLSAISRWKKRGFILQFVLCAGNLSWAIFAFRLGLQTHEFQYTAALFKEVYYAWANRPGIIVALCLLYIIWIPLNALILCKPDWNLRMISLYGICMLLVVLPTNQIGVRIYAPYYLVMCILTCVILSHYIENIFAHRRVKTVFAVVTLCLCILALDFQTQLCARISRVQAERMHRVELLRDEQLLGHSTSDYYLIPVFNVRDAYLGGATTIGTFHYPKFLARYGLRQDTKLIFSNEDCVLVQDQVESSSFRVCVVHQRGKVYLYDYIVSLKGDSSQDYTAIIHEKQCSDSSYQIKAANGEGWYQVKVMLTDPETGDQVMLNQAIEQYLYEG